MRAHLLSLMNELIYSAVLPYRQWLILWMAISILVVWEHVNLYELIIFKSFLHIACGIKNFLVFCAIFRSCKSSQVFLKLFINCQGTEKTSSFLVINKKTFQGEGKHISRCSLQLAISAGKLCAAVVSWLNGKYF